MDLPLKMKKREPKNILITGASSGLGLALARLYAAGRDNVWGISRRPLPGLIRHSLCDVSDFGQVRTVAKSMMDAAFLPDAVFLNAGIDTLGPEEGFSTEAFEKVLQTNLYGALIWIEIFLPLFLKRGRGHFVATASLAAYHSWPRAAAYCASKGALRLAFEGLRTQFQPQGIGFTTIFLGPMKSPMTPNPPPFSCTPEQAARAVSRAVSRRQRQIHYPRLLSAATLTLAHLPKFVYDPLIRRLHRRAHPPK